ncbi:type II toxin-antitoxin system VapC family toxin [bacterium]|nr:type II toxin-antitoxin system VapC family toxin [bacterium]
MKNLLLDTHIWLWLGPTPEKISPEVLSVLEDPANGLFLSAASSWEISIKYRLGKLPLPEPPNRFIADRLLRDGIQFLPIGLQHTVRVAELPDYHSDPFDRLLVAQALTEKMVLVTADEKMLPYEVEKLKV